MTNTERSRLKRAESGRNGGSRKLALLLVFHLAVSLCAAEEPVMSGQQPVSSQLTAGKAALEDGLYELAEKQLREYLKQSKKDAPETDEATVLLARAYLGQEKHARMLRLLKRNKPGRFAFWRAVAQYELKNYDDALSELRDFESKCQDEQYIVRGVHLRARCYLAMDRKPEALEAFELIEKKYAGSPEAADGILEWARALMQGGNSGAARQVLERAIGRYSDAEQSLEARYLLGLIFTREKDWKQAEATLRPLAEIKDSDSSYRVDALFALADVYEAQNMSAQATNVLHRGIDLAGNPALRRRGSIALGRLLLRMDDLDQAIELLQPFISSVPQDPMAGTLQLEVAEAMLDYGYAGRAAEEYQYYMETFSDKEGKAKALRGKAWALSLLPEPLYAEAAVLFQKAYELFTEPADKAGCLVKVADSLFKNGQHKAAARAYGKVIEEYPDSQLTVQARYQLAESNVRAGNVDEGERLFRELSTEYPASTFGEQAHLRVAELQEQEGEFLAALDTYEEFMRAHKESPLYVNALHGHGLISYRLLRFKQALSDFEELVKKAPQSELAEQAFYMRGWCHMMLGREEDALSTCQEFIRRFPHSKWTTDVLFWTGEYRFNHGEYDAAEKEFMGLVDKHPNASLADAALFWAGKAAASQKEYLRANDHFQRLQKEYPASPKVAEARYMQGDALSELGKYASAILIFEEVVKNYESYVVDLAWGRKGDCEFALGRDDPDRYEAAMASYGMIINSSGASVELKLQAAYKTGLCYEKLEQADKAFEQYYQEVVLPYLECRTKGVPISADADVWFTRASFDAVEILEHQKRWREAVRLLRRVVDAEVRAAGEAQERINKIRKKHWILFY